jgi:hypothetical protein
VLLVGDAGSFIDPLSSCGVKKARSSGWLAGIAAHTALIDASMTQTAVDFFEARERDVYRSYRRVSADFFAEAAAVYDHPYWHSRAEAARLAGGDQRPAPGSDPEGLVPPSPPEADVRAAFERLRSRERLLASPGPSLRSFERPAIDGHRVVLAKHLASDAYPDGLRYVRGVALSHLVEVAPHHPEVPDGWSAYNGVASPVTLPDYLTALATAFAAGLLVHRND